MLNERNTASKTEKTSYRSPKIEEVGKSAQLLQGPMTTATYYDACTYGMSFWPTR